MLPKNSEEPKHWQLVCLAIDDIVFPDDKTRKRVRRRHYICTHYEINDVTAESLKKHCHRLRECTTVITQPRTRLFGVLCPLTKKEEQDELASL